MAEYTAAQQAFEKDFFQFLAPIPKGWLTVRFLQDGEERNFLNSRDEIEDAKEKGYFMTRRYPFELSLFKPKDEENLSGWFEALLKANKLISEYAKERQYAEQNPNWFKHLQAKYQNL